MLLPHSKKVLGFNFAVDSGFSDVELTCCNSASMGFPCVLCFFLRPPEEMLIRSNGYSKLPIAENVSLRVTGVSLGID